MVRALVGRLDQFRPYKAQGYDGITSYEKSVLNAVKLGQPSRGWTVDTEGSVRQNTATLFFNIGVSSQTPAQTPMFKQGDIICTHSDNGTPSDDRFTVQAVIEQTFQGNLHHFEVVLV